MDGSRFDALAKTLSAPDTRRRVLGLLAAVPILGGVAGILDLEDAEAKDRRRRRKQRHKKRKDKNKNKNTGKQECKPKSAAQVCAGQCGPVKSRQTCGKTVDCGSCDCNPPCGECFTCQGTPGAPGRCVPRAGAPCGGAATCQEGVLQPQGRCDASGACQPAAPISCEPYAHCAGNACATSCSHNNDCVADSFCESGRCVGDRENGASCDHDGQCVSGHCVEEVCCDSACPGPCLACDLAGKKGICTPLTGAACGEPGQVCQADGTCACEAGSCASGLRCLGTVCVCDSTSCPGGCCDGGACHVDDDDACGINGGICIPCTEPATCGGNGTPGVCGCTPNCTGKACGADDDCGGTCASGSCPDCQTCSGGTCIPDATQEGTCCNGASGGKQCVGGTCVAAATLAQCQGACTGASSALTVAICGQSVPCPSCSTCDGALASCDGPSGSGTYCVQGEPAAPCLPMTFCDAGQVCCGAFCHVIKT